MAHGAGTLGTRAVAEGGLARGEVSLSGAVACRLRERL